MPTCCRRNWPKAWTSEQFEAQARSVSAEVVRQHVHVSADLGQHRAWLQELQGLGFDRIYLHNVNREQERFIDDFAEHVLPALRTPGTFGSQPRIAVTLQVTAATLQFGAVAHQRVQRAAQGTSTSTGSSPKLISASA